MLHRSSAVASILILLSFHFRLLSSISTGGDSYIYTSPPPPATPAPCSPPSSPPPPNTSSIKGLSAQLTVAKKVIQRFKSTLTYDPKKITASWSGPDPCSYTGFICDKSPNDPNSTTIAGIDFNGFHLSAPTLSEFLNKFPDLAFFHANSNRFAGTVPVINNQPYLYELDLSNNILSGAFPLTVLSISTLTFLDLRFNKFSGSVPGSLFNLPSADVIFINNNLITGALPATTFRSGGAAYLTLANNGFTGIIPRSIVNASSTLIEVLLLGNRLSGCLPYEAGLLNQATVFDIGNNQVTGYIPHSFACQKKVEQLNLAGNLLYGEVPDAVCSLATTKFGRLENLSLSGNYFTSIGNACLPLVKSGVLDVKGNCIAGLQGQRSEADCCAFQAKPKYCPYKPSIPCEQPGGSSYYPPPKPVTTPRKYVTYSAVFRKHGR